MRKTGSMRPCSICGTEVYRAAWREKYSKNTLCSKRCLDTFKKQTAKRIGSVIGCEVCHAPTYRPANQQARYRHTVCSVACRYELKKSGVLQPCVVCGDPVYRQMWQTLVRPNPICSAACKSKWFINRLKTEMSGANHYSWKGGKVALLCQNPACGREFFVGRNYQTKLRRFCSRSCHAICSSGVNSHSWKGGISSARDKQKTYQAYKAWRIHVFERDHFTCVVCLSGSTRSNPIEAHHLKTFGLFPELSMDVENGCTLCRKCHKQTYKLEPIFELFLRNRILRDFTSDTRVALDIVKIKSDLRSDAKRLAEMTSPAQVLLSA